MQGGGGPQPDPDAGGRFIEPPLLPELPEEPSPAVVLGAWPPDPAPGVVVVKGARLVRVHESSPASPDPRRRRGHTEAVILAWTSAPAGIGVLLAWQGIYQRANGRVTGKARYAWCYLTDLVEPRDPPRRRIKGADWHGHHHDSQFAIAVRAAAGALPGACRAAALTPDPEPAPPWPPSPPGAACGAPAPRRTPPP